jgi:hypothetical protein
MEFKIRLHADSPTLDKELQFALLTILYANQRRDSRHSTQDRIASATSTARVLINGPTWLMPW